MEPKIKQEYSEQTVAIATFILLLFIAFCIWAAFSFICNVLFGEMTASQFMGYFPDHVETVAKNIYRWFENIVYRVSH